MPEETNNETLNTTASDYLNEGINAVMETSSTSIDQVPENPPETPLGETGGGATASGKETNQGQGKETTDKGTVSTEGGEDTKGPVPYERFSKVIGEKNAEREARIAAETRLKVFEEQQQKGKEPEKQEKAPETKLGEPPEGIKDPSKMSAEDRAEWRAEDPDGYEANLLAFTEWRTQQGIAAQQQRQAEQATYQAQVETVSKAIEQYKADHPDFDDLYNKGEVKKFMDANPLFNHPIAAYEKMTEETRIKAAVEKAAAEAAEQVRKEFTAKGHASVTTGTGTGTVIRGSEDNSLKNASGREAEDLIYQRHLERQRGR